MLTNIIEMKKTKTIIKKQFKRTKTAKTQKQKQKQSVLLMCILTKVKDHNQENKKVLQLLRIYQLQCNQDKII